VPGVETFEREGNPTGEGVGNQDNHHPKDEKIRERGDIAWRGCEVNFFGVG